MPRHPALRFQAVGIWCGLGGLSLGLRFAVLGLRALVVGSLGFDLRLMFEGSNSRARTFYGFTSGCRKFSSFGVGLAV